MAQLNKNQIESLSKLPSLKGSALSILVALLIAQRPLQAQELQSFTGYSDNGITSGLRTLQHLRAIADLGKGRGFMLAPTWQQLTLPLNWGANRENPDLVGKDNRDFPDLPIHNRENPDYLSPHGGGSSGYISGDSDLTTTTKQRRNRDFPDLPVDNLAVGGETTPSNAPEITARSGGPEITAVARWLEKAGISPASHHWQKIIGMGHKPDYVKAHVLELLASDAAIGDADAIKSGGLIYRLEHNWKAPPMRCPECLERERNCRCRGYIPDEYKDIIKR